ncbi:Synaptic vesicle glycoprotein 2C [Trichoplax sp. H2]|nr:Synaptic vesicle glycoprotein 2C [Trichoplax sp. H2]|eukprot:RDD37973.1 Synaptic vesicle glycoprotein 2C [Trichoplax sp. H2]
MLVIMTGFNGCAYGGIATAAHSYVLEFFPRHSRGRAGAVLSSFLTLENLYNSAIALPLLPYPFYYAIGSIYFTSWRLYILISAIPALLSFCTLLFMPNSIRFVLAKNDKKAFRDVLNKIDQINSCFSTSRTSHDKVLYSKITTLDLQQNDIHSKIRKEERRNFADDIRELMKQPWRRRFILLSIVWIGYSIADHGFTIWLPTVMASYEGGKTCWHGYNKTENIPWNTTHLYNGVNSDCKSGDSLKAIILDILIGNLFSLPVTIFCFLLINRVGRKVLYIILTSISGFCILMILLLDNRLSVMIIACIFTAITTNAWIPCKIWTTELFHTKFRSTVVGILFVIGYSGLIVGLILFAKLYYINCIATYTIFASLGLLSIIAALFLPDTSNSDIR